MTNFINKTFKFHNSKITIIPTVKTSEMLIKICEKENPKKQHCQIFFQKILKAFLKYNKLQNNFQVQQLKKIKH